MSAGDGDDDDDEDDDDDFGSSSQALPVADVLHQGKPGTTDKSQQNQQEDNRFSRHREATGQGALDSQH